MNTYIRTLIIGISLLPAAIGIFLLFPLSQSAVLNVPFDPVTQYMTDVFRADVTAYQTNHRSVKGPHFLATNTLYTIKTEKYERGKVLRFQAGFGQIGSEYNTFTIERIDDATTRLTVDQSVTFIIPLPYSAGSEKAIINAIETDLKTRKRLEQSGAGHPPPGGAPPAP